jgi:RNA polymerase sigma factor (sigma-70 family)
MCVLNVLDNEILKHPVGNSRLFFPSPAALEREPDFAELAVQRCLNRLRISNKANAEEIVREIISVSADRLRILCKSTLSRNYPRLAKGPLNLRPEELLSLVVERLMKAMRSVHLVHFRQFFALAVKHIRWELNEQARAIDGREYELLDSDAVAPPPAEDSQRPSPTSRRILETIDALPPNDREVFELVRLQGMSQVNAAEVLGVSVKTVQRRLNRALPYLSERLRDLDPVQWGNEERTADARLILKTGIANEQKTKLLV